MQNQDNFERAYNSDLVWGVGIGAGAVATVAYGRKIGTGIAKGSKALLTGSARGLKTDAKVLKMAGKGIYSGSKIATKGLYHAMTWNPFNDPMAISQDILNKQASKHGFWSAFEPNQSWYRMGARASIKQAFKSGVGNALRTIPIAGGIWSSLDFAISGLSENPFKTFAQSTVGAVTVPMAGRFGWAAGSMLGGGIIPKVGGGLLGLAVGVGAASFIDIAQGVASYGAQSRYGSFGGPFQDSLGASTMRQASLMAIRNSELNNRNFILGNEARMLTGNF